MLLVLFVTAATAAGAAERNVFKAGAYAMNVNPTKLPVIVNGGFREKTSDTVFDPLHARCLVLDDGRERIAIVVVDSCMVPRDLLDQAKADQSQTSKSPVKAITSINTASMNASHLTFTGRMKNKRNSKLGW